MKSTNFFLLICSLIHSLAYAMSDEEIGSILKQPNGCNPAISALSGDNSSEVMYQVLYDCKAKYASSFNSQIHLYAAKAIESDPLGLSNYAIMLHLGIGVSKDPEKANGFLKLAIEKGDANFKFRLASIHQEHRTASKKEIRNLLVQLAEQGHALAREYLVNLLLATGKRNKALRLINHMPMREIFLFCALLPRNIPDVGSAKEEFLWIEMTLYYLKQAADRNVIDSLALLAENMALRDQIKHYQL